MFRKCLLALSMAACLSLVLFFVVFSQGNEVSVTTPSSIKRGEWVNINFGSVANAENIQLVSSSPFTDSEVPDSCRSNSKFMISCPSGNYTTEVLAPLDRNVHQVVVFGTAHINGQSVYTQSVTSIEEFGLSTRVFYTGTNTPVDNVGVNITDTLGTFTGTTDIYGIFYTPVNPGEVRISLGKKDSAAGTVTAEDVRELVVDCLNAINKKCTSYMDINRDGLINIHDENTLFDCVFEHFSHGCGEWEFQTEQLMINENRSLKIYGHIWGDLTNSWGSIPDLQSVYFLMTQGNFPVGKPFTFSTKIVCDCDEGSALTSFSLELSLGKFTKVSDIQVVGSDEMRFVREQSDSLKVAAFSYTPRSSFELRLKILPTSTEDSSSIDLSSLIVGEDIKIEGTSSRSQIQIVDAPIPAKEFSKTLLLPVVVR